MDRSTKIIFSVVASLGISAASFTYAAPGVPGGNAPAPAPNAASEVAPKALIPQEKAVEIALKAYNGAKLINVKLYETVYVVRIATPTEKHYLKIGAVSGRILQDSIINAQGKLDPAAPKAPAQQPGEVNQVQPGAPVAPVQK